MIFLRTFDENIEDLPKSEKKLKAQAIKAAKKLATLKASMEKIKNQLDDIWELNISNNTEANAIISECQTKIAEFARKTKSLEDKAAQLRATYRQIDAAMRKVFDQPAQNYDELFYWEDMPRIFYDAIEIPKSNAGKNVKIGLAFGVLGIIFFVIANSVHATQIPEVKLITGSDGLFSSESRVPNTNGVYKVEYKTISFKACIMNERGYGDGTNPSMEFDGANLSRVTDSDKEYQKGRACWVVKANTKDSSYLTPGTHTLKVKNNAGEVELKILVEE